MLIDSLLGVAHRPGAASFQNEMVECYMPPRHAQLARDFRQCILVRVGSGGAGAGAEETADVAKARALQDALLEGMVGRHRTWVAAERAAAAAEAPADAQRGAAVRLNSVKARLERRRSGASGDCDTAETAALDCAFTRCVTALGSLRRFHLGVATRYLSSTATGTGSSTFRTLLKECIDGTDETAKRRDEA